MKTKLLSLAVAVLSTPILAHAEAAIKAGWALCRGGSPGRRQQWIRDDYAEFCGRPLCARFEDASIG